MSQMHALTKQLTSESILGSSKRGNSSKIIYQITNTDLKRKFFSNRVARIWNKLPDNIVKVLMTNLIKYNIQEK